MANMFAHLYLWAEIKEREAWFNTQWYFRRQLADFTEAMDFNSFSYVNRTVSNHWLFWLSSSDYMETDINLQI